MRLIAGYLIALFLMSAVRADAATDELEDIGPNDTPVTTRIIAGVTVTITASSGYQMLARTYGSGPVSFLGLGANENAPANPSNVSGTRFISTNTQYVGGRFSSAGPIVFEFDQPVTLFELSTLDLLENGASAGDILKLQAFNGANDLVDEHVRAGPKGPSGLDLDWTVTSSEIVRVLLTGAVTSGYAGYGIDDLVLAPAAVPIKKTNWGRIKSALH